MELTTQQVRQMLSIYHDIPALIAEQMTTIDQCKALLRDPDGSTRPAGPLEETMEQCRQSIRELRQKRFWIMDALGSLEHVDLEILRLSTVGPADPDKRRGWRPATWKAIAGQLCYSKNQVINRYQAVLVKLAQRKTGTNWS